jgi:hypothetical protein
VVSTIDPLPGAEEGVFQRAPEKTAVVKGDRRLDSFTLADQFQRSTTNQSWVALLTCGERVRPSFNDRRQVASREEVGQVEVGVPLVRVSTIDRTAAVA